MDSVAGGVSPIQGAPVSQQGMGSPKAVPPLEEALARWQDELLGMFYVLLGGQEEAQEAFREVFLKCWRHREELAQVEQIKTWIFRTALQIARDRRATAWRRRFRVWGFEAEPCDPSSLEASATPEQTLADSRTLLRRALMDLPPEEQEVFLLRQNAQISYEQIAEILRTPEDVVKIRMRRALAKLQQALPPRRVGGDEETCSPVVRVFVPPESGSEGDKKLSPVVIRGA